MQFATALWTSEAAILHRYTELFCGGKTHLADLANDSGAFVVIAAVVINREVEA